MAFSIPEAYQDRLHIIEDASRAEQPNQEYFLFGFREHPSLIVDATVGRVGYMITSDPADTQYGLHLGAHVYDKAEFYARQEDVFLPSSLYINWTDKNCQEYPPASSDMQREVNAKLCELSLAAVALFGAMRP
jgi:hypothetical protein